ILRSCKASKINAALAFWLLKRYSNGASDEELAKALDDLLSCYCVCFRDQIIENVSHLKDIIRAICEVAGDVVNDIPCG
uniref:Uncharacterized protein n=1 Tax=Glossina palpalis gambiensis TaxID=67801 RepID=A0A1B0BFE3_9MUSC